MNITGKDRKDFALQRLSPSAFVVSFQASTTRRADCQCQFSRLSGLSASSSSQSSLRHFPVCLTGSLQRLQLSRGEIACLNKEFPRTEKQFPRTTK